MEVLPVAVAVRSADTAAVRWRPVVWALVISAVVVQIVYPLMPETWRTPVTVCSVAIFFLASLADVGRVHGPRGALTLAAVAGGGGLIAEAIGVSTGFPFGAYTYTGTLGPEVLGVPAIVPMAWVMMAWPALVVGRTLARRGPAVVAVAAYALTAWDVFLDPQMVAAGHWRWFDATHTLPLIPGIPLTNYAGWLLVSIVMMLVLHALLPSRAESTYSGPAAALYLWVYFSSVLAHAVFFGLPGSAITGGLLMGVVALPFAARVFGHVRPCPRRPIDGKEPRR
ncbi:MAG: carotenoid biosynthesis protein [Mycobacterium kyogaense]|uniref:carotenoid biosynthesis protein n=1 Tax=Mycobacterium kyogaense TaxID=2212479 RepID=UPI002FFB9030